MKSCQWVMKDLKSWSKDTIGSVPKKMERYMKKKIEDLASKNDPTSKNVRKSLLEEMEELLQKEETMWRQRSRALWLKVFSQKDFLGEQRKIESRILRIAMATW